ncbi:MAG: DUF4136 domain-containing protein [Halioglobus sp.]|nr:DUF4136 domain-containing protein [Halioglobus sp.]
MTLRFAAALLTLVVLALAAACSTFSKSPVADTDYDSQYDFSRVRKIAIAPVERTTPEALLISDMQVSRINQALAQELQARGYQMVRDAGAADLLLSWHLVVQDKTDVRSYNSMSYYNCWRCGPPVPDISVYQYRQGTFIVDLIDPLRDRSVWRATIQSRLRSEPNPTQSEVRRTEAARAIFAQFPPRPADAPSADPAT